MKLARSIFLSLSLLCASVMIPTQKAHAVLAINVGTVPIIVAAGIVGGIHGLTILSLPVQYLVDGKLCAGTDDGTIESYRCKNNFEGRARSLLTNLSWALIPVSLIFLNGENTGLSFDEISSAQATKLKLNNEAVDTYNQELNEINAIAESTQKKVLKSLSGRVVKSTDLAKEANELFMKNLKQSGEVSESSIALIQNLQNRK